MSTDGAAAARRPRVRFPRFTVRWRILATILTIAALGMTLAGASAYLIQRERHLRDMDVQLLQSVEAARAVVTGTVAGDTEVEPSDSPGEPVAVYSTTTEALSAVVARVVPDRFESSLGILDGAPRFLPIVDVPFNLEDDPEFVDRVVDEVSDGSVRIGTATTSAGALRYIAVPVSIEGDPTQGVFVTAFDIEAELGELNSTFTVFALIASGALALMGVVGWVVAGRLLAPIRRLTETASRITAEDLRERIPVSGRDDVSDLTATVNDMLARLESSLDTQRQLLDDVRHELGTPITIVRGHLELMDARDPVDVQNVRAIAIDELDRMTGLVSQIALLASAEQDAIAPAPTDIAELTASVFAKASAYPDHEWRLGAKAEAIARIDATRITQAWLQLCDNAAKYSPAGSPIEIGSRLSGDEVQLWVADRGPGVPKEARERIFERFGRADAGRGVSGSGLGLAIVSSIVERHGGTVAFAPNRPGSRFTIALPVIDASATDPTDDTTTELERVD